MGLLANVDRAALAAYCQAWGRWVEAERTLREKGLLYKTQRGNVITSPYLWIANKALAQMHQFLTEFGLTPSSRARLAVPGAKQSKDEMEKFLEQAEERFTR
jgi:P27 family predicted phage terminase small subunit